MAVDREQRPDCIERRECPECGRSDQEAHGRGCSVPRYDTYLTIRYRSEALPDPVADAAREVVEAWTSDPPFAQDRFAHALDRLDAALNGDGA